MKIKFVRSLDSPGPIGIDDVASDLQNALLGRHRTSAKAADPVDTSTGNFKISSADLLIPGKGVPLEITRHYNAQSTYIGDLGYGWRHLLSMTIDLATNRNATVHYPDGKDDVFIWNGEAYQAPPGNHDTLSVSWSGCVAEDPCYTLATKSELSLKLLGPAPGTAGRARLIKLLDRNNNTLTKSTGSTTAVWTDAGGRSLTFNYNLDLNEFPNEAKITSVVDPLNRMMSFAYSGDDLTQFTALDGTITTYAYDAHRMTSITVAGINQVTNIYDGASRVVEQTDGAGNRTCFKYDGSSWSMTCPQPSPPAGQTAVIDPRGGQATYGFDADFRTVWIINALQGRAAWTWDINDNLLCYTDQLSHKTGYTYDEKGNVTGVIDANNTDGNCNLATGGVKWTYTYTSRNDLDLETDPLGRQTDYVYDTNGNLTEVIRKDGQGTTKLRTCFTRPASGQDKGLITERIESTTLTDCTGNKTRIEYDAYGNQTAVIDPRFAGPGTPKTTFTYDLGGRQLTKANELNHSTIYTYDSRNHVLSVKDNLNNTTAYTYDGRGSLKTVTDALNKVTTYNYDNADRLTSVVDAANGTTTYGYDGNGNRTPVTNARGKTTTYAYDALNRVTSITDPLSNTWTYAYDAASRLTSRTDAKGQVTAYGYNNRNDLTLIDYPAGTADVTFQYDAVRNRTHMIDGTGTTAYGPNPLNQLSSVTFPGSRTVSYTYDALQRRATMTYPGGTQTVTYGYDAASNLTSVTDWNGNQTTYAYNNAGLLTTVTLPSSTGVIGRYGYDNADRLTSVTWMKGRDTVASATYTLNAVGNRTQRMDQLGTHTYAYDNLHRLTSVTYPGPSTDSYTYDAVGNRLTKNATTYTYDNADRMTDAGGVPSAYDNNGNQTRRGPDTFAWDVENRITSWTLGATTTTFTYNGDGLRNTRTIGGNPTETFTWDVARSVPQTLDDGTFKYVYGLGRIAQVGASTHYYLPDGLGSTMKLVDSTGTVVNTYEYDVYGAFRSGSVPQPNQYRFAGEQTQAGIQYLRARYYDTTTGRFLSKDPVAPDPLAPQSFNPYIYVVNNPINLVDPTGECGLCKKAIDAGINAVKDGFDAAASVLPAVPNTSLGLLKLSLDYGALVLSSYAAVITDGMALAGCLSGFAAAGPAGCAAGAIIGYVQGRFISLPMLTGAAFLGTLGDAIDCHQHGDESERCRQALDIVNRAIEELADPNIATIYDIIAVCQDLQELGLDYCQ